MFISSDAIDAYSIGTLAGAPSAHLLSNSLLAWPLIFLLFTIPSTNLLINLGHVSGTGPVLTYSRIAAISSGIGWALTWLAGERLFTRSLTGSQNLLYLLYSMRSKLNWALNCDNKNYNNDLCVEFLRENVTHGEGQHRPDNNWPAQQFNRYVRGLELESNVSEWVPNAWYFGDPQTIDKFSLEIPAFALSFSHFLIWTMLFLIIHKYGTNPGWFLARFCLLLPLAMFTVLIIGLSIFGFNFNTESNEEEPTPVEIEKYPFEYFSEIHGFYRTTIVLMDYSSAFTGIIVYASSRIRSGNLPMSPLALLTAQMLAPTLLYVLRNGCNGHLAEIQPAYHSYTATDATFSFDTAAVCFATTSGGPLWAVLYYSANLLFSCIGPMAVLLLFIYNSFLEQFPFLEHFTTQFLALICFVFSVTGLLLCMPMGTSFETLLQYVSQSSITQIFTFIIVFFVYGWHNLDSDVRLMLSATEQRNSLVTYLIGPTSPIYTILLFTAVPALLATKFASVFDLLMGGMDILKHIDYGTAFMTASKTLNRFFGYSIMLAPIIIIIAFAIFAFYKNAIVYKMPWGAILDPTADWNSHLSLRQASTPRIQPISHRIVTSFTKISYRTLLFFIFVVEIFFGILILILFFTNAIFAHISTKSTAPANNYRTLLLLAFATFHILALFELRWTLQRWDHSSRCNIFI